MPLANGVPTWDDTFTVGATPEAGLDRVNVKGTNGASSINVGAALFFRSRVLLDPVDGLEGVSPF